MSQSEAEARRAKLADDLNHALRSLGKAGKRNYFATFSLALIATLASVAASILAFLKVDSMVVGTLALLPAMCAIFVSRLKIQERANWYYRKRGSLYAIYNELHFELPDPPTSESIAALSRKWTALNAEREADWRGSLALSPEDLTKAAESDRQQD